MILRVFGFALLVTLAGLTGAFLLGGPGTLTTVLLLAVLEISLSFDNAVVNATVLVRLTPAWQRIFLVAGVPIAVVGMRLLCPLLIVVVTAGLDPVAAVRMAARDPSGYALRLEDAHPMIAAFGGMFLMLLFLDFVFTERSVVWLGGLERLLARLGQVRHLSVLVAGTVLLLVAALFSDDPPGPPVHSAIPVTVSGCLGIATYLLVRSLGNRFEARSEGMAATGGAAFFLFLYLELLDATFSFDGVIGAFAITSGLFVIATGLGIGALYVRSMTVYLVRRGTLSQYIYLEHGAHYAIGALAVTMLAGIAVPVPEAVSGGLGAVILLAALISSVTRGLRPGGSGPETSLPPGAWSGGLRRVTVRE